MTARLSTTRLFRHYRERRPSRLRPQCRRELPLGEERDPEDLGTREQGAAAEAGVEER